VAERLAREAVARSEETDRLTGQGDAWWDLAEVLATAGRRTDAIDALEHALERYQAKKNLAMVAQLRRRFASLRCSEVG
jgi:hypothetical protein